MYEATDRFDHSKWAIKEMPIRLRHGICQHEVRIHQAASNIPGVVQFHECGEIHNSQFIVMERCKSTLRQELLTQEIPFTNQRIKQILLDITATVRALHAASIYHLDLKLGNILLCSEGKTKIADFGHASFTRFPERADGGTLQYMSPGEPSPRPPSDAN